MAADAPYLPTLTRAYHGLRPLVFVLDTTCDVFSRYWQALAAQAACRLVPAARASAPAASDGATQAFVDGRLEAIGEQVVRERAHFGLWIDGAGETLRLVDERGRAVPAARLFAALAASLLGNRSDGAIVLEAGASDDLKRFLERLGAHACSAAATRQAVSEQMQATAAILGGGASGRCWFPGPAAVPDALATLTLLLSQLSETDRPLSEVLDASVPTE